MIIKTMQKIYILLWKPIKVYIIKVTIFIQVIRILNKMYFL